MIHLLFWLTQISIKLLLTLLEEEAQIAGKYVFLQKDL
jgi:hypothetical protein